MGATPPNVPLPPPQAPPINQRAHLPGSSLAPNRPSVAGQSTPSQIVNCARSSIVHAQVSQGGHPSYPPPKIETPPPRRIWQRPLEKSPRFVQSLANREGRDTRNMPRQSPPI